MWREIKNFFKELLLFIFPPECPGCGKIDIFLCKECGEKLHPEPIHVSNKITASLSYKNPVLKRALWLLKYQNRPALAKLLASLIYETLFEELAENNAFSHAKDTILVAVPMSPKRIRRRGYNHANLIAKNIAIKSAGVLKFYDNALFKTRETKNQAKTKNKKERLKNLTNSMSANPNIVSGKHVIIIDDVITTGATLLETSRALKKARAKSIRAYVVAH